MGGISARIEGVPSLVNAAFENNLFYRYTDAQDDDIEITFEMKDDKSQNLLTAFTQLPLALRPQIGNDSTGVSLTTIAIYAGISASGLLCCMCCYSCLHAIFRKALLGERTAVWIVKNLFFTHIEEHPEDAKARRSLALIKDADTSLERAVHAEKVRLDRIVWCAHLPSRIPCCYCCAHDFSDETAPSEEELLQVAVDFEKDKIAKRHLPKKAYHHEDFPDDDVVEKRVADDSIFDWEKHLTDDGKVFYFNSKTQKSQWDPPVVEVHNSIRISKRMRPRPPAQPKPPKGGKKK